MELRYVRKEFIPALVRYVINSEHRSPVLGNT